jgi:hypothetical protein
VLGGGLLVYLKALDQLQRFQNTVCMIKEGVITNREFGRMLEVSMVHFKVMCASGSVRNASMRGTRWKLCPGSSVQETGATEREIGNQVMGDTSKGLLLSLGCSVHKPCNSV